jgi:EmrB/QacA subfamily drug resistance transporter
MDPLHRRAALALLCTAQFVVVLDVTFVAVALPAIGDALGFSVAELQWVVSAYAVAFGGCLVLAGRAADRFGRRRVFVLGLAAFAAASLACALARSPAVLVGARVAQGLGAAALAPAALALVTATFRAGGERSRAVAVWTASAAAGGASGWVLGGLLTTGLGWEWIFAVNVPIGALGIALAPRLLAESRDPDRARRLDVAGAAALTSGMAVLVLALTRAERVGLASADTAVGLLAAAALLAAWPLVQRRAEEPLVPLAIFRERRFAAASGAALALTATTTPAALLCVLYLERALGHSALETGLACAPLSLAVIAGSALAPRIAAARATIAGGLLAVAAGAGLLVALPVEGTPLPWLLPAFALMGAGLGAASVAATAAGVGALDPARQGLASGVLNAAAQLGSALGVALLIPLAAARAAGSDAAGLVAGYDWGFGAAVLLALAGAGLVALRAR